MASLKNILQVPHYGYERDGELYRPSSGELLREYANRINIFAARRNWWPLCSFLTTAVLIVPLVAFLTATFDWRFVPLIFLYVAGFMNIHGTAYIHRYASHHAFQFRNRFILFLFRNLSIKVIMEEMFVVSHYVHHRYPEKPGDPYNTKCGRLYCLVSDVNHQQIRGDLTEPEYDRISRLMAHTGVRINSYEQYQRWGSITHPGWTVFHYALNWAIWFGVFFLLGGFPLACAMFGGAFIWGVAVRNFNYKSHGSGKDKRKKGLDFAENTHAINIPLAGFTAGEWHSNHHLYPTSAKNGYLWWQFDPTFWVIRIMHGLGIVRSYKDYTEDFYHRYYEPYLQEQQNAQSEQIA